jgi:pleckstrin family protein A (phosphoinositide binding specific) protein 8
MKRYKSPWTCTRDAYPTVIEMEGILWKWTNYVSGTTSSRTNFPCFFIFSFSSAVGWQQRWFVLNSGVLAYYISQNEVSQGCKGSLKVASCDITGRS